MKKDAIYRVFSLLAGFLVLPAIIGCGGGGGGGGTPPATALSVTTDSLPAGVRGQLYYEVLQASGGTTPYSWSATGLPPGVSLDTATGVLSGAPTTVDVSFPTFTVTDDAGRTDNASLTLVIQPPPSPSVSTGSLPPGVPGQPYSATLSATGGTPPYVWSATGLSSWISLSPSGGLTGTPSSTDTSSTPVFTVTDNNGMTGNRSITIVINSPPSPVVATAALPSGVRAQPYAASLAATSGTPPYTWSVTAGTLPAGVTLIGTTGSLTGTPTEEGTFTPTFTVADANNLTGNRQLSILINPPASPAIGTSALPAGARTEPYSAALSATGGTGSYTWSVSTGPGFERLPAGVSVNGTTGFLSGTPTEEGTFSPVFTVTDSATMQAMKSLDLRIAKPLVLSVADYSTPSGAVDIFDSASVADGVSAWTRRIKGTETTLDNAFGGPPAGVSYDAARQILYVARTRGSDNGATLAFHNADTIDGNAAPTRTIRNFLIGQTPGRLKSANDVFIDSVNDRIFIAGEVEIAGSPYLGTLLLNGASSPTPVFRKFIGFSSTPAAISVDLGRNILYVVPSQGPGFVAYDNVSGSTGGLRAITISGVTGVGLVDVKVDPATDTAYAADYDGGRVFVINNVSQKSGSYPPDRTLSGLSNPNSVFPDVANNRLFVSNRDGGTSYSVGVVENMTSVNGPVSFSRRLSGFGMAAGMTGFYK